MQVNVQATDSGSPAKFTTTTVTIDVARDLSNPDITNLPAPVTLAENSPNGTFVFKGTPVDADLKVGG